MSVWLNRSIGTFTLGLLCVYLSFVAMLAPAILAAHFHFAAGYWVLGMWSLASIIIVPKAVLGFVLLIGRKSGVSLQMSVLVYTLYPRTVARYAEGAGIPAM